MGTKYKISIGLDKDCQIISRRSHGNVKVNSKPVALEGFIRQ
jgi:hypothetical protein